VHTSPLLKVLIVPFIAAAVWDLVDPWDQGSSYLSEVVRFSKYLFHSAVIYFFIELFVRISGKSHLHYFSFANVYLCIVCLVLLFWLIWVPYGPYIGVFDISNALIKEH
jgi:hypothetical protein